MRGEGKRNVVVVDMTIATIDKVEMQDVGLSDVSVKHRCAFKAMCSSTDDLVEIQTEATWGIVWGPVLEYKTL